SEVYLPIPVLIDLVDTFFDHLSRIKRSKPFQADFDEEYLCICANYTSKVHKGYIVRLDSFYSKISATLLDFFKRGTSIYFEVEIVQFFLSTLQNISFASSPATRSSIFNLFEPYINKWFRIYKDSQCHGHWMYILSNITLSSEEESPNDSLCSEAWPLFHTVLDVVKREFVGDKIVGDGHEEVIRFFTNLCCDPSHAIEVYDNVKDLLDGWFEIIREKKHKMGTKYLFEFLSMLSTVPSLLPHISPKYERMKWCRAYCLWEDDYKMINGSICSIM
ncbi:hypothetical protein ADUPG1_011859, partial [Aduncisulcus paluster]